MALFELFADRRPSLTADTGLEIKFDASLSEDHSVDTEWTSSVIESGARLFDHKVNIQRVLTLTVLVSSAKIRGVPNPGPNRHHEAWSQIVQLCHAPRPYLFEVTTERETLDNVVLKGATAPRTAQDGRTLTATLQLLQLEFADVDEAINLADAAQDLALAEVDLGSQGLG